MLLCVAIMQKGMNLLNIKKHIIVFPSYTYCGKAKAVFDKNKIISEIIRTPRNIAGGCGYSVVASAPSERLTKLLENEHITYKTISEY